MNVLKPVLCALLGSVCIGMSLAGPSVPTTLVFNRDIRPILSDKCFACHGPDKNKRQADLRLDEPNRAVVPGDIVASELARRIGRPDGDGLQMPPSAFHKTLTAAQKTTLLRWIGEGAVYQKHWSFELPVKAAIPVGRNAIDYLVQRRLAARGLTPSPTADRRTLLRRLSYDLTGLPPTPDEVAAFIADRSPDAYARQVERLLASPHYGERMAQGWLDVVRFADTIGYHSDTPRNIWPYRDYVIAAFNSNKRFDQFTREQLAGDLLPEASQESRVGSAFNRLLLTTEEGGAQAKDYEARYLTDRVRAVGAAWLGLTTGCAQCHDHKFDPFTTRDFYRLGACFADVEEAIVGAREPGMPVPSPEQAKELARLETRLSELQRRSDQLWRPFTVRTATALEGTTLTLQPDGAVLAGGSSPEKNTYTLEGSASSAFRTLRLEVLPDSALPARGPGRAGNGNFVLSELAAQVVRGTEVVRPLRLVSAQATTEQTFAAESHPDKRWSAASALTPDSFGWAVLPEVGKPQSLVVTLAEPVQLADGESLQVVLRQNHGAQHTLGRFRLSVSPEAVSPALTELEETRKAKSALEAAVPRCLVTIKSARPRTVRVLPRGNFLDETGEIVTAGLPSAFVTPFAKPHPEGTRVAVSVAGGGKAGPATRLELANWLVSRQNPLTARTIMNRLWKQFFGTGLSKVLDDLGAQGEPPANPALLDWLACQFQESGWDVKQMVRLLVTSNTYKQVSTASRALLAADPDNREYARQSRFRLEAEGVRDNALAVAGLLNLRIGGPSAKPYQPERYWENLNFPVRDYLADKGEDQYRRGLYTWWQRSFLHPSLLAFDAPTREECAADRPRSNLPQQALVLLNDPTYVEAARVFAVHIQARPAEQRLTWAWQQALQRAPSATERATLQALYTQHLAAYRADPAGAEALLSTGNAPLPPAADRAELAAWAHVARVLLNLHETITRS